MPFAIIHGSTFIVVDPSTIFFALGKLAVVLLSVAVDVEAVVIKFIIFPEAHEDVLIGEGIHAFPMPAFLILANVLPSVGVANLVVLRLEIALLIEELSQELLAIVL